MHADPTGHGLRGPNDVDRVMCSLATSDDTASLELCSPAKALIVAPSGVTHLHHLRNCLRALFTELFCVWVGRGSFGVRACTPVRALAPQLCGYHLRCVGPCFQGLPGRRLHGVHLDRAPWPCSALEFAWLAGPFSSRLLCVARVRLRLVTPAAVAGQRLPLDHFRLSC